MYIAVMKVASLLTFAVLTAMIMVVGTIARNTWPELNTNEYTKDDGVIEEVIEEVIERETGVDVDLSPFSEESRM